MRKRQAPQLLQQTINSIKEMILEEGLRPGDALPTEPQLSEALGVSRANLREAIRTLATLDIVEVHHGTGTFVGQMSLQPLVEVLTYKGVVLPGKDFEVLRQIVEIRRALDLSMAPNIIEHLQDETATELESICLAMEQHRRNKESFAVEDRSFHRTLANITGNDLYGQLVAAFWDIHTLVVPRLGVATPEDIAETVCAHKDMISAAKAGDLTAYQDAIDKHYAPLLRVLEATPVKPIPQAHSIT